MKVLITILFFLYFIPSFSQENKIIRINTISQEGFYTKGFIYPQYENGKVNFKDGSVAEAPLNYSVLNNQVYFLNRKKDTLILAHPETIKEVLINTDTFCFYKKDFIKKISHYSIAPNLFEKKTLKYIGKEKKGPYGTYSGVSASESNSTFYDHQNEMVTYIALDENLIFSARSQFYITVSTDKFYLVTKSNLKKAFPEYDEKLKEFISSNKIDLDKRDGVLQLITYIQELKSK